MNGSTPKEASVPGARLEWTDPSGKPCAFFLRTTPAIIGRRSDADIVLTQLQVSRQHARIEPGSPVPAGAFAKNYSITDLGSSHGTWINGIRKETHTLAPFDRIRIGEEGIELVFLAGTSGNHKTLISSSVIEDEDVELSVRKLRSLLPSAGAEYSELEKISCLLDFHYSFGKSFSAERTFQHILKSALAISGAERAFVLTKHKGDFKFAAGLNNAGKNVALEDFQHSATVVDRVSGTGQPVFMTQGIEGDLAGTQSIVAMNLRAIACLPLEAISTEGSSPGIMGILYLDSRGHMHALSGLDEKLLVRLAGEAGNVLEKLEMVVALAERKRIEQELEVAEETQRSLLPQTLPEPEPFRVRAFSRPTRQLGGDFYDFIPQETAALTGVLADVSGKGIPAALLSSLALGAINMEFRSCSEPDKVLNNLNKLLCTKTPSHRFVTLFLFQLQTDGTGIYISAGHNTAYLYRAATGEVEELPSGGVPLGLLTMASYQSIGIHLDPGDLLFVYSDGLTEAENSGKDEFGETRVVNLIRECAPHGVDSLKERLLAELDEFTGGAGQTDDITFLIVAHKPAP